MSDPLVEILSEIAALKKKLEWFVSGEYLTGPKVSVPGNLRTESDLQVGSGVVIGNGDPTLNPGNGEVWLQSQGASPSGTSSVLKMLNVNNQLVRVNDGGQAFRVVDDGSWMQISGTLTRFPTHTNLIVNPTFEVDTTGWAVNGAGSSAARQASGVWGSYCARVVMAGAGTTHLFYTTPNLVAGSTYRVGFYARSVSGNTALHCELHAATGFVNATLTTSWQYFSFTGAVDAASDNIYWWLGAAGTFEIDGVSCILTSADPPYSDPMFGQGQVWSGTAHASASYRTCEVVAVTGNIGDRLSLGQRMLCLDSGAWKNFYLISFWFDPYRNLTVMMLYGGSSYVLAANPTALYFGTTHVPVGFTDWMFWTPQFTGFSVSPTGNHLFCLIGRTCFINVAETGGTANAGGFTLTGPLQAVYNSYQLIRAIDNGALSSGLAILGGLTMTLYKDVAGTPFTAAGTKYAQFTTAFQWA